MKSILLAALFSILLIGGAFFLRDTSSNRISDEPVTDAVSMEEGVQVISILARGGYSPRNIEAVANVPTILRVATKSTFDCSAALTVPAVGFREILPMNGEKEIKIPAQKPGSNIKGLCSMGMYSFTINFK